MSKKVAIDDEVEESVVCSTSRMSRRAPKGHFVVYVGTKMTRFVVPTTYLKNPRFQELLDKAADEYGLDHTHHKIVLPCDESAFLRIVSFLSKNS